MRARTATRAVALLDAGRDDAAPELSLLNLVDLMLVFALGLMLAIASSFGLPALLSGEDATLIVETPGRAELEVIVKKANKVERLRLTRQSLDGQGVRIGTAYRLTSGEVVYVPEAEGGPPPEPGADRP